MKRTKGPPRVVIKTDVPVVVVLVPAGTSTITFNTTPPASPAGSAPTTAGSTPPPAPPVPPARGIRARFTGGNLMDDVLKAAAILAALAVTAVLLLWAAGGWGFEDNDFVRPVYNTTYDEALLAAPA